MSGSLYVTEDIVDTDDPGTDNTPRSVSVYIPKDSASGIELGAYARIGGYSDTEKSLASQKTGAQALYGDDFVADSGVGSNYHQKAATLVSGGDDEGGICLAGNGNILLKSDQRIHMQSDGEITLRSANEIKLEGKAGMTLSSTNKSDNFEVTCNKYKVTAAEADRTEAENYFTFHFAGVQDSMSSGSRSNSTHDGFKLSVSMGLLNISFIFAKLCEQHISLSMSISFTRAISIAGSVFYPVLFGFFIKDMGYSNVWVEYEAGTGWAIFRKSGLGTSDLSSSLVGAKFALGQFKIKREELRLKRAQVNVANHVLNARMGQQIFN